MSKMNVSLRRGNEDKATGFDVGSIMITVVEGDVSRRYRIKAHDLAIRVSLDGQMKVQPLASNLVEIESDGW